MTATSIYLSQNPLSSQTHLSHLQTHRSLTKPPLTPKFGNLFSKKKETKKKILSLTHLSTHSLTNSYTTYTTRILDKYLPAHPSFKAKKKKKEAKFKTIYTHFIFGSDFV
jgi:hypothetical protein